MCGGQRASQATLVVKNPPASARNNSDVDSIPESERSLEEGMATLSSILARRIPTDRGAWWVTVHGDAKRHDCAVPVASSLRLSLATVRPRGDQREKGSGIRLFIPRLPPCQVLVSQLCPSGTLSTPSLWFW